MPAEEFVVARMGAEVRRVREKLRAKGTSASVPSRPPKPDEVTRFRAGGEVHRWMYDRQSLRRLLHATGFEGEAVCRADESRIPEFARFHLDADEDERVRKPDSLFFEASKPDS
jgi:hypothetical protein